MSRTGNGESVTPRRTARAAGKRPFQNALGMATVEDVPLCDIMHVDQTFQYRLTYSTEDLEQSLAKDGQREPVDLLGPMPYRIIDGFRRIGAIQKLEWTTVKAIIHPHLSEEEAHTVAFLKNVVRRNFSPLDKAYAIRKARARGRSLEQISRQLGISERQVIRYEALLAFPPEIQALLEGRRLTMAHAHVLAEFAPPDLDAWAKRCHKELLSSSALRKELRKAAKGDPGGRKGAFAHFTEAEIRLYTFRVKKGDSKERLNAIAEVLRQALGFVEQALEGPPK